MSVDPSGGEPVGVPLEPAGAFAAPSTPGPAAAARPPWSITGGPPSATGRAPVAAGRPAPRTWWRPPQSPPSVGLVAGCLAAGLASAVLSGPGPLGLNAALVAAAIGWSADRLLRHRLSRGDRWLILLAVALAAVAVLRDSTWLVRSTLLAAFGLLCLVTTAARQWLTVLFAVPVTAVAVIRSVGWVRRLSAALGLTYSRARAAGAGPGPGGIGPWLRGAGLGVVLAWVVGALLASADAAFSHLVSAVTGSVDLSTLPGRAGVAVLVCLLLLGIAYARAGQPDWPRVSIPRRVGATAEWAVPLAFVDAVLALFVMLQAASLFGGAEVLTGTGLTYAQRAREGFGQLVAVTLLTSVLLAWSARRADDAATVGAVGAGGAGAGAGGAGAGAGAGAGPTRARHPRRVLGWLGGALVALTVVVVASALRRMWLYERAYGWTVLRVGVAAFELWLAATLTLVALAWLTRRTGGLARLVLGGAGVGLLALALVNPDALVARLDVQRYAAGGGIDMTYLSGLSADAVPDLDRLPEPQRSCAMAGRRLSGQAWYGLSVSRVWADAVLAARPVADLSDCPPRDPAVG